MTKSRKPLLWLLVPLALIVLAGWAAAPADEYAALDRIGTRIEGPEEDARPAIPSGAAPNAVGVPARRTRTWSIRLPEPAARRAVARVFDPRLDWWQNGTEEGEERQGGQIVARTKGVTYRNLNTNDDALVQTRTPSPPGGGLVVKVTEAEFPPPTWMRLWRRLKRTFVR